jgi:hypothetical protein
VLLACRLEQIDAGASLRLTLRVVGFPTYPLVKATPALLTNSEPRSEHLLLMRMLLNSTARF